MRQALCLCRQAFSGTAPPVRLIRPIDVRHPR
jgi:hypothetical protein